MKTRFRVLNLLIVLSGAFTMTSAYSQTTYTWIGSNGGDFYSNTNWNPNGIPGLDLSDTAQWDGMTTSPLTVIVSTLYPLTSFPLSGVNFVFTANQISSVTFTSTVSAFPGSAPLNVDNVTIASGAGAVAIGDSAGPAPSSTYLLNFVTRPAGVFHDFQNNSSRAAIINGTVRWVAGGGAVYTLDFDGAGDWIINNYLVTDNNTAIQIQKDGTGTMTWTPTGYLGNGAITSPIVVNAGTLILESSHPYLYSQTITNKGIFQFDAPAQSQSLSGVISGSGLLQVNAGTLTLSGQSTYTGTNLLTGGELIVVGPENPGVSGPLGVGGTITFAGGTLGFSANNANDYSGRFDTSAGQQYSFHTAGQNVTFTNNLASSGGTLTKLGGGTLTLAGTSSYSGLTAVSGGELVFQGSKTGTGDITVADGAVLGVTDTGTQMTPGMLTLGTSSGCTLEFDNVNSTTRAPIAAGTLSSAGMMTINVNSGTFTPGLSYPLLSWTSGSAPAVTLGEVNNALGFLSTNGNTLKLNIAALHPPTLNFTNVGNNSLQFSWTGGFKLQVQTNSINVGLSNNWVDYPGGGVSGITVPIDVTNGTVFFRLAPTL